MKLPRRVSRGRVDDVEAVQSHEDAIDATTSSSSSFFTLSQYRFLGRRNHREEHGQDDEEDHDAVDAERYEREHAVVDLRRPTASRLSDGPVDGVAVA